MFILPFSILQDSLVSYLPIAQLALDIQTRQGNVLSLFLPSFRPTEGNPLSFRI